VNGVLVTTQDNGRLELQGIARLPFKQRNSRT
jgi:hypothetical protein